MKGENKSLLIVISENKIGYDIYASRPGDDSVSSGTANGFGENFKSVFDSVRLSRAGLTDEQIAAANKTVSVYQSVAGEPTENDFGFVVKWYCLCCPLSYCLCLSLFTVRWSHSR